MAENASIKNELLAQESSIADSISAPEARFECPICLNWLRDPVLTSCGHRFCRRCIQPWLEDNPTCPVDNMKLQKDHDIFPDNFTRREISQHRTKCPNIVRGCYEELSPLDVEAHLIICKFNPPQLPDNEKLRCLFVDCGCEEKFEDEPERQKHLEKDMQRHLTLMSQTLSKVVINNTSSTSASAIAQQANFWDPQPKGEQNSNFTSNESIDALLKSLYEKIVILEQKSREQDIIISNMSNQIAATNLAMSKIALRHCNGCYLWFINDIKNKINTMRNNTYTMFYSPGFYSSPNGYKLCVRFNLSTRNNSYIAVLVHMMKTEHDNALDWPFSGRISVSIVHPNDPNKNIKETMMTRPELEAFRQPVQELNTKGFGYTEFASLEDIIEQGFIDANQLIIKVQVQPV
ncbi:TNF receptor-associated factor 6 isoform X2 [Onthophagus taurus]|uniref:TNF receptor-associated factor 6 isoform X2 n=1 Tax=Onthophagus taurus TaxID=166361 RepID=UPI000C20016B|nr:TNF receptor-associated factor 6-like isoform X2 [Onthophagus taurus]